MLVYHWEKKSAYVKKSKVMNACDMHIDNGYYRKNNNNIPQY